MKLIVVVSVVLIKGRQCVGVMGIFMGRNRACREKQKILSIKEYLHLLDFWEKERCSACQEPVHASGFCKLEKLGYKTEYRECVFIGKFSQLKKD